MTAEATEGHRWLQRLVGDWSYEVEGSHAPDAPPQRFVGTESIRSLDGLWIVAEARGDAPGGGIGTSITALGFDPLKGRFVGSFVSSVMPQLWVYEGVLDAAGDRLVLECEGPGFTDDGSIWKYRDTIELRGDDVRILRSECLDPNEGWRDFLVTTYRRSTGSAA